MTKNVILSIYFCLCLFTSINSFGGGGFYENNTTENIEVLLDSGSGNFNERISQWSAPNLGTYYPTSTFKLNGATAYIWKSQSSDVTSMTLYYRVYDSASTTPPVFSSTTIFYNTNVSSPPGITNQRWQSSAANIDLLNGLSTSGAKVLEVYIEASTNGVDGIPSPMYFSNFGSNFIAYFNFVGALPVNLLDFSVFAQDDVPIVQWSTASEVNASHYNIYASANIRDKIFVAEIGAKGNTNIYSTYSYAAIGLASDLRYFFLEQVDIDGRNEWFGPVEIFETKKEESVQVYLLPNNKMRIKASPKFFSTASLLNVNGAKALLLDIENENTEVQLKSLRQGLYLLHLKSYKNQDVILKLMF